MTSPDDTPTYLSRSSGRSLRKQETSVSRITMACSHSNAPVHRTPLQSYISSTCNYMCADIFVLATLTLRSLVLGPLVRAENRIRPIKRCMLEAGQASTLLLHSAIRSLQGIEMPGVNGLLQVRRYEDNVVKTLAPHGIRRLSGTRA